jgi:hypothetical protein
MNCPTPDFFICLMIVRNPWRVFNVIHPTNNHWKLAAIHDPTILTEMPIDLREEIQSLIRWDEVELQSNYDDLHRYDNEYYYALNGTESDYDDCDSYDDGYDS